MNKIILLLFLVTFTLSCKKGKVTEFVILSGISNIDLDTIYLRTHQRFYLNSQKKESYVIEPDSKHKFHDTLINLKGYYELIAGNKTIPLYLKQGFNLNIDLKESDVIINGNGAVENRYLQEKKDLESNIAPINFYQYYSYLDEARFLKLADSIKTLRDKLIKSYNIPDEQFKFIEESFAKIEKTEKHLKYTLTRKNIDTNYIPSKKFPMPYSGININDERLIEIPLFKVLMFTKVIDRNQLQNNPTNDKSLSLLRLAISDELKVTNQVVKEQLAFTSADWTIEGTDSLDLFYKIFKDFTKNKDDLKKITSKYLYMKGLSNGNQAPYFEFYNEEDELISLESLKDHVIYLDIWATYCKPCIEEIEPSNKLQKKLSNKKIKFISICIGSKKESWSRLIKEKEFSGIQLFCPKIKEDTFKENYLVESLPRYLIIDKNGKIYDFHARKPSDTELEQELLKLL